MHGHALEDGVVLLQLKALVGVLFVLGGDIAGSAGEAAFLHLGAFEDDLYSIAFALLGHNLCIVSK